MTLPKLTKDIAYISKLDNDPSDDVGMSPQKLRMLFDQGSLDIQDYLNLSFIPRLETELSNKLGTANLTAAIKAALLEASSSGAFDGADGREIELQSSSSSIQWRYRGESTWRELLNYSRIKGDKGEKGEKGDKGDKGDAGESPYEAALRGGFTGTEDDFYRELSENNAALTNPEIEEIAKLDGEIYAPLPGMVTELTNLEIDAITN